MNNIKKLQNIFKELRKDDEEGHGSTYQLQWEDIETIENLIKENKELKEKAKNTMGLIGANYIYKDKVKDYLNKMEKRCNKPKFSIMKKDIEKLLEEGE